MNQETLKRDLEQMEQRYSDGFLDSDTFWKILVIECCLLGKKYGECHEEITLIVNLFEKIGKEMNFKYSQSKHECLNENSTSAIKSIENKNTEKAENYNDDQKSMPSYRKNRKSPYER